MTRERWAELIEGYLWLWNAAFHWRPPWLAPVAFLALVLLDIARALLPALPSRLIPINHDRLARSSTGTAEADRVPERPALVRRGTSYDLVVAVAACHPAGYPAGLTLGEASPVR